MTDPYFPVLHRVPPRGWINDPNGIVRHEGRWHVFFQYNPASTRHENVHWGHVSSRDLLRWREEPLGPSPRPGELDAGGCWSGVATIEDGVPTLVYSGVDGIDDARSRVLVQRADHELRHVEPVPGPAADVPPEPGLAGVRDPFLFELDGRPLAVQGAELRRRDEQGQEIRIAAILAWDRSDITAWRYLGVVLTSEDKVAAAMAPAQLWECPQLFPLRDEDSGQERWVLSVGLWTEERPGQAQLGGVAFLVGDLRWEDERPVFTPHGGDAVDAGPDFYAPQVHVDPDSGRVLMWGWSWEGAERTSGQTAEQGWAGCLTFPRELALVGDELVSRLPEEFAGLRGEQIPVDRDLLELETPARAEVRSQDGLRIDLLAADGAVARTVAEDEGGAARVLLDASVLELLPDRGVPQTVRLYPAEGERLRVTGKGLEAWSLGVPRAAAPGPRR